MKRILTAAVLVVACSSASFAVGIKNSKHDLSSGSSTTGPKSTNQGQICIFCHTPHNSTKNVPLWNRQNGNAASTYRLYTSSPSLTQAKGTKSALSTDSVSLFCLSCHDGTVAELGSRVVNKGTGITMGGIWTGGDATTGPKNIGNGGDLTNDHPIAFPYPTAGEAGRLETAAAALTAINAGRGAAPASGAIFFNSANGNGQVECASCHLVHDNSNVPFLRATGATLCVSCHLK